MIIIMILKLKIKKNFLFLINKFYLNSFYLINAIKIINISLANEYFINNKLFISKNKNYF